MAPQNSISAVSYLGSLQGIADNVSETSLRPTVILYGVQIPSVFVLECTKTIAFFVKHSFLFFAFLVFCSLLVNVIRQGTSWFVLVHSSNPTAHVYHDRAVCVSACCGVSVLIISTIVVVVEEVYK